ncbi:hypothetical protein QJS66_08090 [Kocuria rhizophila]|nr:hypothetical protein QJS66_08090 [Kocuria rhizophila]
MGPVEALVAAAPMMESWAITATLDALLSAGSVTRCSPLPRSNRHRVSLSRALHPAERRCLPPTALGEAGAAPITPGSGSVWTRRAAPSRRGSNPVTCTPDVLRRALDLMPPHSGGVRAVRVALGRTAANAWSPWRRCCG